MEIYSGISLAQPDTVDQFTRGDLVITNNTAERRYQATKLTGHTSVCGMPAWQTMFKDIFVIFPSGAVDKLDLDPFTAINTELDTAISSMGSFMQYEYKTEINHIWRAMMKDQCETNRELLEVS